MIGCRGIFVALGRCVQKWRDQCRVGGKVGGSSALGYIHQTELRCSQDCRHFRLDAYVGTDDYGMPECFYLWLAHILSLWACTSTLSPTPSACPIGARGSRDWPSDRQCRHRYFSDRNGRHLQFSRLVPEAARTTTTGPLPSRRQRHPRLQPQHRGTLCTIAEPRGPQITTRNTPTAQLRYFGGLRYQVHHRL